MSNSTSDFIPYEYINTAVKTEYEPLYSDCYLNFGWQPLDSKNTNYVGSNTTVLKFKRDRSIKNRSQLHSLQRKCENAIREIERLDDSKEQKAFIISFVTGFLGLACIAGAVFSFLAYLIPLFIGLVLVGGIGCAIPYFIYQKIKAEQAAKTEPKIEQQYEQIYKLCEQARNLWA